MGRRGWLLLLVVASVLALVALASNATTTDQVEGQANTLLAARKTVSHLLSAGTIWAGLAVWSGWLVRGPIQAFGAGIAALVVALLVHYRVGLLLDMFDPDVWTENSSWFLAAVVLGGPLGVVGAIARRPDVWGVVARLVVPVGAVLEPFVVGMFTTPAMMPWPTRFASVSVGVLLVVGGTVGCLKVLAAARRQWAVKCRETRSVSAIDGV